MKLQVVYVILILALLIAAAYSFINLASLIKNVKQPSSGRRNLVKYLPAITCFSVLIITFAISFYYDYRDRTILKAYKELGDESTSLKLNNYQKAAVDKHYNFNTSQFKKIENNIDSNYNRASSIKAYVSSQNAFKKVDPNFKDSVDSTYHVLIHKKLLVDSIKHFTAYPNKNGYAYYGIYRDGQWIEQNFTNVENSYPKVGEMVKCLTSVNIRKGEIQYIPNKGYVNQAWLGGLVKNQTVKVDSIMVVAQNYIWIKFNFSTKSK